MNFDRLHIIVDRPGSPLRLGPDEADEARVPSPPDFGDSMPGGFADCSFTLPGQVAIEKGQQLRVLGAGGGRSAWEGRISQINPTNTGGMEVQCEGMSAHLRDDRIAEIYAHRDYSDWSGATVYRRLLDDFFGRDSYDTSPEWDGDAPSIHSSISGPWSRGAMSQAVFDAGAARIAKVWRQVAPDGAIPASGGSWSVQLTGSDDPERLFGAIASGEIPRNSTGAYWTLSSAKRYLSLWQYYATAAGAAREYSLYWRLALYGDHGLPLYPVEGADPGGVAGSDAVAHALGKAAPMLKFTTGNGGSIEPSNYIPPHLSFVPSVPPEDIVTHIAALGGAGGKLLDWGVFDDSMFFMRTPGTYGREWRVRVGEGATLTDQGDALASTYNGVIGSFTDHSGASFTIGPPGSGCDIENALLLDTSESNPINAAGIPRKVTEPIDLGTVDPAIALRLLQVAIIELSKPMSRGELTLTGPVRDSVGAPHPPWAVRSGDRIIAENEAKPRLRTIVDKRYSHASRQATVSTDSPPNRLDAVIGRLRAGADQALG